MRIRIGNQSAFSASTITQPFEYAVANGFDAFAWFPDKKESGAGWTESDISKETRGLIMDTALAHDIVLSVHAPWQANPLKLEAREVLLRNIEFARDVRASLLNIHLYTDDGIDSYVQAIIPVMRDLAQVGMKLSIENTPLTTPQDFNELFRGLRNLNATSAAHVGMCFDLGHANLCEQTRNDYLRFIDLLDPQVPIIHLHMHENYGDWDSHLPLFTGPAGKDASGIQRFIERIKKRRFSGSIILEQWPEPPSLLNKSRNRLLEMIGIGHSAKPVIEVPRVQGDDFVDAIVEANRRCRSWREKLAWIEDVITEETFRLDTERLVYLMIYLRFIGTGQLRCSEDGRHFRPSHHAKMAWSIHDRLSKMTTADNVFVIRKIYPWLPSCATDFAATEPLTRIRHIAHRNDIPKGLKQEIKRTLQNKLHRCAGPEDLSTSAALLERITAPGAGYSADFVKEFKKFHEELKEFFNARFLEEQLEAIAHMENFRKRDTPGPKRVGTRNGESHTFKLIGEFLQAKEKANTPKEVITTFELLTTLRSQFHKELAGDTSVRGQELRLADIKLEDFSFVLLSRLVNYFEALGEEIPWSDALHGLAATIENLRLSSFDDPECQAIESELALWSYRFDARNRDHLIRLKATIDRCRRLSEVYCNKILSLFPEKVERLGLALGVGEHAIKVFCEADIRSHLVFQLSKLVDLLLRWIRAIAELPSWDAIVFGKVSGRLVEAPRINDLTAPFDEPIVALLEKVEGEEEIPSGVAGMVVAHAIPRLSHIAVRARQGEVVFAVCEDADRFAELRHLVGKRVVLDVSAQEVNPGISGDTRDRGASDRQGKIGHKHLKVPDVILSSSDLLISLNQVTLATGGSKADGARELEKMSKIQTAGFRTPLGLVVPFGVMEESLHCAAALEQEFRGLVNQLNEQPQNDFLKALKRLQDITGRLSVPQEIVSGMLAKFPPSHRLIVRSSANCEDLEGLCAAGLYDSVANLSPSEVAQGVSKVWASLWTRRAAMNRKKLNIPHDRAHMAVLIQQMLVPEFSFIMHTVNPINYDRDELYVELAVGLGQTLASGKAPGVPYRMVCHKYTGEVRMLAFASFSHALWSDLVGNLMGKTIDYSKIELSRDGAFRDRLGSRLGAIGRFVEDSLGRPQDIEGLVLGEEIYLVQARPQCVRP